MTFRVPMPDAVAPRLYTRRDAHWLLSVDLGKTKVGVARWWVTAKAVDLDWADTLHLAGPPERVARDTVEAALAGTTLLEYVWVCEWPMKYPTQRKFHADLDALHAVGNAISSHDRVGPWTRKFRPGEWKGNVPKAAHHDRLRAALGPLDIPHAEHDTWDAVGIGAYALGLTRRGGVR